MTLIILTDKDIRTILLSLSRNDITKFHKSLADTLHDYSTGTVETTQTCSTNQPQRISLSTSSNQTTLFMPAATSSSTGIKIVSLANPAPTPSTSTTNPSPVPPINASLASNQSTTPRGSLTLLTTDGAPYAFLNAEEITAFRTALASTLLFSRRRSVHTLAVFGAGKQAYWHIRLALLLRGAEIHHVHIINRSFARAQELVREIYTGEEWTGLRTANDKLSFSILTDGYGEYRRLLKENVREADALFLCTPSTEPLFPPELLTATEGRKKGRYLAAIGSYKPYMQELHPDILRRAVAPDHGHHHHRHAERGGCVVVDSIEACLKEAGEVIKADLDATQLVEIGELVMVGKAVEKEKEAGGDGEKGLWRWLEKGDVIYKSVGLGVMDVSVGEGVVGLARERGVGVVVEGF